MFSISTMVQQDNFLTYIKNSKYAYYYPLFVFILETALRVGEVCGLTWDDVDLEHGFVNITHQLQYNNVGKDACQYQILTPKSKSGVRNCKLCLNGMPVPLLRNCYSIFNGTKYR